MLSERGGTLAEPDSLYWENDGSLHGTWRKFLENDIHRVFNHIYGVGVLDPPPEHYDFGLQFLASGRREYGTVSGIPIQPEACHRIVDFDLTQVVRYWVEDTSANDDRNNGLMVQAYSPTRHLEPDLHYHSSEEYGAPSILHPSILVYEAGEGDTPKELGAPFGLFYEAPPDVVRVFELAHLPGQGQGESWLAAVNSSESEQCLRIYTNDHRGTPDLAVYSTVTGDLRETIPAYDLEFDHANFDPNGTGTPNHCPGIFTYGIPADHQNEHPIATPWWPDDRWSYQPITRWDLTLQPSNNELSAVLIRVPHPSTQ